MARQKKVVEKSELIKKDADEIKPPKYTEDEETYIGRLRSKMENARIARDTQHPEFDGMDYITYFDTNERLANTFIEPKKNKEDSNFQSGLIRTKIFNLLASVVALDLSGDISAFDKNGFKFQAMGDAMEDVILKTNELDNDEEKKQMRQYELLKQGSVFVEEVWDIRTKKEKKMAANFSGKLDVKWETRIKKAFARPSRNIIPGINVYLGDITKYNISEQPFIFTVDSMPYEEAKTIFGEWERWDNVPKKYKPDPNDINKWRLLEIRENYCEIIRYQDKWNNEFAVKLNGVLMTPVGLPLPWGYEDYNIAQQNLEPIHNKFAYGKSLVFRLRNKVAIYDELTRLSVLKSQKSFLPPKFNLSGRVLTARNFMPGKINYGVDPRLVFNADDKEIQGVTQAEFAMLGKLQESIDGEDSPRMSNIGHSGKPTVTEILEYQRQAKVLIGLTIFSVSMLEWKLEWLRLQNILKNWFNPEDKVVDEMRDTLRNKYRQVSVPRNIEGQGQGMRMVIPTDQGIPSSEATMKAEDIVSKEQGMPVRFIFLDPAEITSSKICWQITIIPKEKKTSETGKLLFRSEMQDALILQPDMEYVREKFASVWGENPKKMFTKPYAIPGAAPADGADAGAGGMDNTMKMPTPEKSMGNKVKQALTT